MKLLTERILHPELSFRFLQGRLDGVRLDWHQHNQIELTWLQTGSGIRFVGDNVSHYLNGDMALIGANLPHLWQLSALSPAAPVYGTVIQFPSQMLAQSELPELRAIQPVIARASLGLTIHGACRDAIEQKLVRMSAMRPLARLATLFDIFSDLGEGADELQTICTSHAMNNTDSERQKRIEQVFAWIHTNLATSLEVEQAAAIACISPAAFSRFFKRETGKTFSQYVIELRCSAACLRLVKTDRSIARIAEECGFSTLSNFNRIFLNYAGKTPRVYRRSPLRQEPSQSGIK